MKCGVGSYTQCLANALAERVGVKVGVLTNKDATHNPKNPKHANLEIYAVIKKWHIFELIKVIKCVANFNPDIIHIQYPTQGYSGRIPMFLPLVMLLLRKKCLQTWHEPILDKSGILLTIGMRVLITVRKELLSILPRFIIQQLKNTNIIWVPTASLLPTVAQSEEHRLEIRKKYITKGRVLLVFYGFLAPLKGIEALFEIVARTNYHLLLACDFNKADEYHNFLLDKIKSLGISSKINIIGFLPDEELSSVLSASDVAIFPFRNGFQAFNTSVDGAIAHGLFVLTTSTMKNGYDVLKNIYFAKVGDIDEMILAIQKYSKIRNPIMSSADTWDVIVDKHIEIYKEKISIQ